jgi:hypothetical protein
MIAALEGGEWSAARARRTLHPGKFWYPFYRRPGIKLKYRNKNTNTWPDFDMGICVWTITFW